MTDKGAANCDTAAGRLAHALEMHDIGVHMMRRRLCRENPEADQQTIAKLIEQWLRERPGAVHGDVSPGCVVALRPA